MLFNPAVPEKVSREWNIANNTENATTPNEVMLAA